ncbi:unnamed protein product [Orchesella dallaii]|uniref:XK-related protein n=1 Tax=Orchesella dallaii TaxID=48710 RepID=A0ABP1RH43_9HEXA
MSRDKRDSIMLTDITHYSKTNGVSYELTSADSDNESGHNIHFEHDIESLPPLASFKVTSFDVFFNFIVIIIVGLEFTCNVACVVILYNNGYWATGFTLGFILIGTFALLAHFWTIPQETLNHVYGNGKVVRILVNAFPHLALFITVFECTRVCFKCKETPVAIPQYIKLDELSRSFLKVYSFACSAPIAVLQLINLIVLVEEHGHGVTETVLVLTVILNLTTMMVGNLPGKYENSDELPKAAYIPGSRVFVGLRMSSSFGSRTMSLAYLFVCFKCIGENFLNLQQEISYLIPLALVLVPRFVITIVQYVVGRCKGKTRPKRFTSVLIGYIATVFFPFGDPPWVFWYIHIETFVFALFGVISFFIVECGVNGIFNSGYFVLFLVLYFVVPCLIPYLRHRVNKS